MLAAERIRSLLNAVPEPILFTRITLTMAADPAVQRPALAEVNVEMNGRLIRAQAPGQTMCEAIERVCDRLRIRLERAAALRGAQPGPRPGEWRHQSVPAPRLPYYPGPPATRAVMRRTSYTVAPLTADEAVADAEMLGYEFHLFTEKSTGEDAVVYRIRDGYRLALAHPRSDRLGPVAPSITVSKSPVPRLSVIEATAELEAVRQRFLFFVNPETGRGNLIYHRYDGHYGLIEPAL
jgi:ribosome-associated translation inhibitor RaiA